MWQEGDYVNWQYIILHHTVTPADRTVEQIRAYHKGTRGYLDIGYNWIVDQYGTIHKGRSLDMAGAHTYGYNKVAIGIAAIGNFEEHAMPEVQRRGVVEITRQVQYEHNIPLGKVLGHRDVLPTACPGRYFPMDEIKKELERENMSVFKDLDQCWYPDLMLEAVRMGLVAGVKKPDGVYLEPKRPVTREESILIDLRQHKILDHLMDIPGMVQKYMPSVVRIWAQGEKYQTVGSGSFVSPSIILTNAHVVGNNSTVSVDTHDNHPDNNKLKGKVVKVDKNIDLALVELNGLKYTPLKLADSAVHGEFCLVLGNPGGEFQSVTFGIVAHNDRGDYIETDARINPGNSGGAVINERGELIGVPSHKIVPSPAFDNQNYAIRIKRVKEFIKGVI